MRYIYLHGFASSPSSRKARAFERAFSEHGVPLEIPQLDGGDFEHLTLTGQLQVVERLLKVAPACLMGSSMGGYLASLYATTHPEVKRLVLLAPAFGLSGRWENLVGKQDLETWQRTGQFRLFHYGDQAERTLNSAIIEDSRAWPDFPDATQPTLIFHGVDDTIVPVHLSRSFAASRSNVTVREMPSDHELLNVLDEVVASAVPFILAAVK